MAVAMLTVAPAMAQTLGRALAVEFPWWRWFAALGFCLLLAVAGAYALRARTRGRGIAVALPRRWSALFAEGSGQSQRLAVVEVRRISPSLEVCLLRCDGREYLLAATAQGAVQLSPSPGLARAEAAR